MIGALETLLRRKMEIIILAERMTDEKNRCLITVVMQR